MEILLLQHSIRNALTFHVDVPFYELLIEIIDSQIGGKLRLIFYLLCSSQALNTKKTLTVSTHFVVLISGLTIYSVIIS